MSNFNPRTAIIPGRILANLLFKENISQKDLSQKTGITEKHISNIVQGKASITEETAIKFEYVFGGSASFWINLQKSFDEISARLSFEEQLTNELPLVKNFPFNELVKYNFVAKENKSIDKLKELLKFFSIPSLNQVKHAQSVAYHQTAIKEKKVDQNAVAAWLRIGDIKYKKLLEKTNIPVYNESEFRKILLDIKRLTREKDFFAKLPKILLDKGVILLDSPYLSKTYISGAVRWIGGRPIIQINDHLKNKDSLFFTIFHEFAHILLHDKREDYLDYEGLKSHNKKEREADDWACEILISEDSYNDFLLKNNFSITAIETFSRAIEVSKDVVIGRLAYDGKINWKDRTRLVGKVIYRNS